MRDDRDHIGSGRTNGQAPRTARILDAGRRAGRSLPTRPQGTWVAWGGSALRTLGVTSCRAGEGVSTVAAHLATSAAARQEGNVVLVDANLSGPSASRIFGVPHAPGLFECVLQDEPVVDALFPTAMENLRVLPAGKIHGSPARVYDAENLLDVVADVARHSALAIFDLPPVRQVSCAHRLTAALDGVVLVVEAESIPWDMALRVKDILNRWREDFGGDIEQAARGGIKQAAHSVCGKPAHGVCRILSTEPSSRLWDSAVYSRPGAARATSAGCTRRTSSARQWTASGHAPIAGDKPCRSCPWESGTTYTWPTRDAGKRP